MTRRGAAAKAASEAKKQADAAKPAETRVEDYLSVDPMEVEIGVGLIRLADPRRGGDLLERIQRVRQNVAGEIGIILPKVRIRDNMRLDQNQYRIKIADMPVAEGMVYAAKFLAMDPGSGAPGAPGRGTVPGMATREPAFGTPAVWIEPATRDQAEMHGYTVVEPGSVIATHLTETIRRHADEILTRDSTKHLIDELKRTSPVVVDELIPGVMKLAKCSRSCRCSCARACRSASLARSWRRWATTPRGPRSRSCWRSTCGTAWPARSARGTATPRTACSWSRSIRPWRTAFAPASSTTSRGCSSACRRRPSRPPAGRSPAGVEKLTLANHPPVVLVSPQIRAALRQMTVSHLPNLVVLSYNEITRDTKIEAVAMVSDAR